MSHGQPASVLLHTVGYLLLHPPSYYPLITYWAGRRGKWVSASIAPTPIHFLQSGFRHATDTDRYNTSRSPGSLLKLINSPPELCRCPSEQACSIPRNTHILLPGTFHAIINPDFCPIHRGGIFRCSQPVQGSIWKRGVTRWGKIGLFSLALVMLEGGGQLCRWQEGQASKLQGGRRDSTQLSASSLSLMDTWARRGPLEGAKPGGVGPSHGTCYPQQLVPDRVPKCRMAGA